MGRPPGPAAQLMLDPRAGEIDRLMDARVPKTLDRARVGL